MGVDVQSSSFGTALITGASSGIGSVYADRLAQRGYDLLLVARDAGGLEAVRARLAGHGRSVAVLAANLNQASDLRQVEERLMHDASITMLVNNAGIAITSPFSLTPADELEALVRLNVLATTRLARAAASGFGRAGRGAIINIASVVAFVPEALNATYPASKAYMLSLTHALHAELGPRGVRVQAVCPGITITDIWTKSGIDPASLPSDQAMPVGDMVDAALAGFDLGEVVTLPALDDLALYNSYEAARLAMGPHLSRARPAARYRVSSAGTAA